jgi:hypothetical protein
MWLQMPDDRDFSIRVPDCFTGIKRVAGYPFVRLPYLLSIISISSAKSRRRELTPSIGMTPFSQNDKAHSTLLAANAN